MTSQSQKSTKIPFSQIHKHKQVGDCWLVISNKVFDVSKYMLKHPGGRWIMLENSGKDATSAFQRTIHSEIAMEIMYELYIGDVQDNIEKKQDN